MRIIISPAKKMRMDTDSMAWRDLPAFLPDTEKLLSALQALSTAELKALWKCSDSLVKLNEDRLRHMNVRANLTPAIWAYEGIQYQHMLPEAFTDAEFAYVQQHLRILSGFYGILRPFDGVTPYRLEMQAKLPVDETPDLYAFWGNRIAQHLFAETDCILNLASKEYSQCVEKHLTAGVRFITCIFGQEQNGRIVEKGTLCKMARGEMVRFMAENRVEVPEQVHAFHRLNFCFSPKHSTESTFVFLLG